MKRYLSVDIFRGITVAVMILVNCIGMDTQIAYPGLVHAPWHGCTIADLVFPFFIFTVGISAGFSITALQKKHYQHHTILNHIIKRSLFLFAIGCLMNAFPHHMTWATLDAIRWLGVLQRIAICYCCSAVLFLYTRTHTQIILFFSLLIGYWLLMTYIPVPGLGAGHLTPTDNLAAFIDRLLIPSKNLYQHVFDPEGLFSTLPAIATALSGNLLAAWLLTQKTQRTHLLGIIPAGLFALLGGALWGMTFPMNKTLWTSTYVLWTSGIGLLTFAACYWLVEIKHYERSFAPFILFGKNALTAFTLHTLFLKAQPHVFRSTQYQMTEWLTQYVSPQNASLLFACCFTIFWLFVIMLILWVKRCVKRYINH